MSNITSWLQSSEDPTQVSNKVRGFVLLFSSVIIFMAAAFFGIRLSSDDIITFASGLGAVAGSIWTIYGFVMHFITWLSGLKKNPAQ